jgi:copper chaperone CopZ
MTLQLKIDGMHCQGCVTAVRQGLEGISGVTVKGVGVGNALVELDARVTSDQVVQALGKMGFEATVASAS